MKLPLKPRKRIYLINRDFQLRYTRAAVIVGVISTALTAVLILYPLFMFEILKIPKFLPTPILISMIVAACINCFIVALMGVFVTHKIAGPIYSLVKYFRSVGGGLWNVNMRIREDDELRYLVRNFNEMADGLIQAAKEDLHLVESLDHSLALQKETLNNSEIVLETVAQLRSRLEKRLRVAE